MVFKNFIILHLKILKFFIFTEPKDNSTSNREKDFGSACQNCKKIVPRRKLYKHVKWCLKFERRFVRNLDFEEEIGDPQRVVEIQSDSTDMAELNHPSTSFNTGRTTSDQVLNSPFTQGPPSESIVTLSSSDESERNHLPSVPVYRSGNSIYIGSNVRVTNRLRTPNSHSPSTITSPLDLTINNSENLPSNN